MSRPEPSWLSRWSLALGMVLAIGAILGGAVWTGARANQMGYDDFAREQETLASAVAIDFEDQLTQLPADRDLADQVLVQMLAGSRRLEKPGELVIMVARPNQYELVTTDGRIIGNRRIQDAIAHGQASVMLPRDEAAGFGLPRRRAFAGIARVGSWSVVVLTSAWRMRLRQEGNMQRIALSVIVSGAIVGAIGIYARRRTRRALELEREIALANADKMATLAALSTGIAHEIGTPLSVIVGRVEQVLARPTDDRTAKSLGIVVEQVERIQRIMRGSLALARGESPELVPTPAAAVVKRAADLVRHRFAEADVTLVSNVPEGLPNVACDAALFEQALVNLLLNACQATPAKKQVTLGVEPQDGYVRFVVEDEGAGITDDVASRAGAPFFSTKREQGGSGLGLTIAREIVKHHGGELALDRRADGRGSRATITALEASA